MTNSYIMEGEYKDRGEYHKHLDPNWSYYPIYIRKMNYVDSLLNTIPKTAKILDAGCGEGVLVEKYRALNRNIVGIDYNVENEFVVKGDILKMPFEDKTFDVILLLDVIEHLHVTDHKIALEEIKRILKDNGIFLFSVPNLAHKASRISFYKTGRLIRTANINKHPGDRPVGEYVDLITAVGFNVESRIPIMLTLSPLMNTLLSKLLPKKLFEQYIYSKKRNPSDCFLNIFKLTKKV